MDSNPIWDAIDTAADESPPIAEPEPGTLLGIDTLDGDDLLLWAPHPVAMEAMRAAGCAQTVAFTPSRGRDPLDGLGKHAAVLDGIKKIIIAGGARDFVDQLARRLGRHRVWRAVWPPGCADAADALQNHGADAVKAGIDAAEPYPIQGIYRASAEAMLRYLDTPQPPVMSTGCAATDKIVRFPTEGKIIIITGIPSHGKSVWALFVAAHTADVHNRRWAIFSPEMSGWESLAAHVMASRARIPFRPTGGIPGMTREQITEGAEWCRRHFVFLNTDTADASPTVEWLFETARACVLQYGTTDLMIDPYNELEIPAGQLSDTDFIARFLQRCRAFATRYGCNVWIVAHPKMMRAFKPNDPLPVPTPYDINGGANWYNKGDLILTVHRPDTVTEIHCMKAKFWRYGARGKKAE